MTTDAPGHDGPAWTRSDVDYFKNLAETQLLLSLWDRFTDRDMIAADDWVMQHFRARDDEESRTRYPKGTQEAYYRDLVANFWELGGYLVSSGRVSADAYFGIFGGHPRSRWEKYRDAFLSARANPYRPESRRRAEHFEWLALAAEARIQEGLADDQRTDDSH